MKDQITCKCRNERRDEDSNKRRIGSHYEEEAAGYLNLQGIHVLEQNFRCHQGEIDLVCRDGRTLVFVEVKYRKNNRNGDPAESVNFIKQQRIRETARYYLYSHRYGEDTPCRFDVVSILGTEVHWIKNAF